MDIGWEDLVHDLTVDLGGLECQQFVIVEYCAGLDPNPYAQAALEAAGDWYCELVSSHYLPESAWAVDEFFLVAAGWEPPDRPGENWSRHVDSPGRAAAVLVEALRFGRACRDSQVTIWRIGRFPPPPDDGRAHQPVGPRDPLGLAA